jgi:N-acyl-D-aspartate/D-glutamate deacylase
LVTGSFDGEGHIMLDYIIRGGTVVDGTGSRPRTADVGVRNGAIVAVGAVTESAAETIDADGALVTPGFIDLHTHYDGQITWDDALEPSVDNGVSTVVLGNCGVGFAPVRPADHETLIDMMEGVEDIPGTALSVGMPWGTWESFPDYLDLLSTRRYAANVTCHISHGPLRYYVMGERAYEDRDATADDIEAMAKLVSDAMAAGAAGFSTNRWDIHKSRSGKVVPGTYAPAEELRGIAKAVGDAGHGVIQTVSEGTILPSLDPNATLDAMPDLDLLALISIETGRPVTFSTFQASPKSGVYRRVLDGSAEWNAKGAQLRPQIIPRAVTMMTTLDGYHGFIGRPSYQKLADLPVSARAAEMRRPEVRERILSEAGTIDSSLESQIAMVLLFALDKMYSLSAPIDYEPDQSTSVAAQAQSLGVEPAAYYYDLLTAGDGDAFFSIFTSGFQNGTLEPSREMLMDSNTVSGLSDAGAHVMFISDCSSSTFHLTHWVRDRTKGDRVPLELAVNKLTGAPAQMYGFTDRGVIAEGRRADLNVIDFDALTIQEPFMRADLPNGSRRILQPAVGYVAQMVEGVLVRRNGIDTGARPGRLLRSSRTGFAA